VGDATARRSPPEALVWYAKSRQISEALDSGGKPNLAIRRDLLLVHGAMGDALLRTGDPQGALRSYTAKQAIAEELAGRDPADAQFCMDAASAWLQLGRAHAALARVETSQKRARPRWLEARSWSQKSLDAMLDLRRRGLLHGWNRGEPEKAARHLRRCDRALAALTQALARQRL
jgi:hypothetical protein